VTARRAPLINPTQERDLTRLGQAHDRSRYLMEPFRKNRFYLLEQLAGDHYSDSAARDRVILNTLQQYATIFLRLLVPHEIRPSITARSDDLLPLAADMETWFKRALRSMKFHQSLRVCALDAFVGMGILKIGEAYAGDVQIGEFTQAFGQAFVEPVDLDDWCHDMTAKRLSQCQFMSNRYRVRLSEAKECPIWDVEARDALQAQDVWAYNDRGDLRVQTLSQTAQSLYDADIEEHCELLDIWLPKEKLVVTIQAPAMSSLGFGQYKPLNIVKWTGPPEGPFAVLSFIDLPNNSMPIPPMSAIRNLHELVNILWRKLAEHGIAQKEILAYSGSANDDAKRLQYSNNGEAVLINMMDKLRPVSWGGMKPENMAAADRVKALFNEMSGNLALIGGTNAQSPTLGQDEILNRSASAQITEMQERMIAFARDVFQRTAQVWWENPVMVYEDSREVAGQQVPVSVTPQMRQRPFKSLDWDIDPYSMSQATPEMKLAGIKDMMGMIAPFLQMAQQQGVNPDWPYLIKLYAQYRNSPEIARFLKAGPPPEQKDAMQQAGQLKDQLMQPNTTRTNVRINRAGAPSDEAHNKIMQQLLAGGTNGSQQASLGRQE
jgi:hypothetical protein